jgi:hypothetical protein
MNTFLSSLLLVVTAASMLLAQEKTFSLYAATGYGFPLGGRYIGSSDERVQGALIESKDIYLNYGRGIKAEGGVIIDIMPKLGVQAGVEFSGGLPRYIKKDKTTNVAGDVTTTNAENRTALLGFKAVLLPRARIFDLLDIFTGAGLGLYLPFSSYKSVEEDLPVVGPTGTAIIEAKYEHLPTVALIGTLGAEFPLSESFILTADMTFQAMNVTITKVKITRDDADPTNVGTINYELNATDRNEPPKTPGSNLAVRVGFRVPLF